MNMRGESTISPYSRSTEELSIGGKGSSCELVTYCKYLKKKKKNLQHLPIVEVP